MSGEAVDFFSIKSHVKKVRGIYVKEREKGERWKEKKIYERDI